MSRMAMALPGLVALAAVGAAFVAAPRISETWVRSQAAAEAARAAERLQGGTILDQISSATRDVAHAVAPSVVYVATRDADAPPGFFGGGSGWVWDAEGHVVTNAHVVDGAERIEVQTSNGEATEARVVGIDLHTDVALLETDLKGLVAARRSPERPQQGEMVFAFGSPFEFRFSMSSGVVSGLGRTADLPDIDFENFIQVDAAINPGNSGGPLTNVRGEVIGMNTAIATGRGNSLGQGQFAGVGLAIPVGIIENVVEQLLEHGEVHAGFLGISMFPAAFAPTRAAESPVFAVVAERFGSDGLVIDTVSAGTPAAEAGMRRGDVLVRIDGIRVDEVDHASSLIATRRPGQVVRFELWRANEEGGELLALDIPLARRAPDQNLEALTRALRTSGFARLSTSPRGQGVGVIVEEVVEDSALAKAGVVAGTRITAVAGSPVRTLDDLYARIARLPAPRRRGPLTVTMDVVSPDGGEVTLNVPLFP